MNKYERGGIFSFLNFSNPLSTNVSVIIIIIISSLLVYLILKALKAKAKQYHLQEYWESRYSMFPQEMDWYTDFQSLSRDFKIPEILSEYCPNKKKCKILELGCGNSGISSELYQMGYQNITAIDFSSAVINQMKQKYDKTSIQFICGDFNRLNEYFDEGQFDLVIEKAGLDSIATKETSEVPLLLRAVYNQIYKVLKPHGRVLSFSIKNLDFWTTSAFDTLKNNKMFVLVDHLKTVFTNEKNPIWMNLYFYHIKKIDN